MILGTKSRAAGATTSLIPVAAGIIRRNGMEVNWVISVVNKQALIEPFFRVASGLCTRNGFRKENRELGSRRCRL